MYVNPFAAGIFVTIVAEIVLVLGYCVHQAMKNK